MFYQLHNSKQLIVTFFFREAVNKLIADILKSSPVVTINLHIKPKK